MKGEECRMGRGKYLLLFALGLAVAGVAALFVQVPGYMDAEYYYAGGVQLAQGRGFQEPFLWNYLDDPSGLPHPSHTYWMPLPSILAAAGMRLFGRVDFSSAQAAFILLAALIPPVSARLSFSLLRDPKKAFLAGLLALFPGFYLPYLANTESFSLYMLLGALFLLAAFPGTRPLPARFFLLGLLAGLMHLSRADGLIWLAPATVIAAAPLARREGRMSGLRNVALVWAGYGLLLAPWYLRNLGLYGRLFSPGGAHTLWLTRYDQTFAYPPASVSFEAWLAAGWALHFQARWDALRMNLGNFLAVQAQVFLLPFLLAGLWRLRRAAAVRLAAGMWALTLAVMTLAFPFAGARGGFLHSGAAFQPFFWAIAPLGLEAALDLGVRLRGWQPQRAWRMFAAALIGLSVLYTGLVFMQKVVGANPDNPAWRSSWERQAALEAALAELGVPEQAVLMLNNPPGAFAVSGRASIAIPDASAQVMVDVARHYSAAYLLLDENHVPQLDDLYDRPRDIPGLVYLETASGTHIFRVEGAASE